MRAGDRLLSWFRHRLGKVPPKVLVLICGSLAAYESEDGEQALVADVGETDSLSSSIRASRGLDGDTLGCV